MPELVSSLQRFVDRLAVHSPLSDDERQAILDLPGYSNHMRANDDIVAVGDQVDYACLITHGIVGSFGQAKGGSRQITALHIPGDMAGLQSVVQPDATLGLQALSATTICRIPHQALRALTGAFPAIAEAFWRNGAIDAAVLSQWTIKLGRLDAVGKLAHLLCEMSLRYGGQFGRRNSFEFPVTQTHLANVLGLTAIHVNRTVKVIRDEGLVTIAGRTVEIHDWDQLAKRGEFGPAYLHLDRTEDGYHGIVATG